MPDARVRKTPFFYGNTHPDHGCILFLYSHFDAVNGKSLEMSGLTAFRHAMMSRARNKDYSQSRLTTTKISNTYVHNKADELCGRFGTNTFLHPPSQTPFPTFPTKNVLKSDHVTSKTQQLHTKPPNPTHKERTHQPACKSTCDSP